jgi:hypothetical protein
MQFRVSFGNSELILTFADAEDLQKNAVKTTPNQLIHLIRTNLKITPKSLQLTFNCPRINKFF